MKARDIAMLCAALADSKRASDIVVLDIAGSSDIADYFVLASATSARQMAAVAEEIRLQLKRAGNAPLHVEGSDSGTWVVLDFADCVVHVFTEEARAHYQLEGIWADAGRVDWQQEAARKPHRRKAEKHEHKAP